MDNPNTTPPYLPQQPGQQPRQPIQLPVVRQYAQPADRRFALGFAVLSVLLANTLLWYGVNLGVSVSIAALMLLTILYLMKNRMGTVTPWSVLCFAGAFAGTVSMPLSSDEMIKTYLMLMIPMLNTLALVDCLKLNRWNSGTIGLLGDCAWWGLGFPFSSVSGTVWALTHSETGDGKKRRLGSAFLGALCALPALVVLGVLLVSSDAAFEGMLRSFDFAVPTEFFFSMLFGFGFFLIFFSQCFGLKHTGEQTRKQSPEYKGIDTAGLAAFLGIISALYVLYLVSQLAYCFSGFAGILPEGFTPAAYARRGFFEMTIVCVINFGMVSLALLLARKRQGKTPSIIKILLTFICLFSLLLIAAALSKMALYIDVYGMTRLRILTSVFIVFLSVTFVTVLIRIFVTRLAYIRVVIFTAAALLLALSFVNVDRVIANYNITAWQQGKLEQIDVDTIGELSEAAVPYLWQLWEQGDEQIKASAADYLTWHFYCLQELTPEGKPQSQGLDLRRYNRDTARALEILIEHWDEYGNME